MIILNLKELRKSIELLEKELQTANVQRATEGNTEGEGEGEGEGFQN